MSDGTSGVILFGAQAETGDIATDYIATTSAAVSVGPVANLPRLDYSGGASCPKLLLEPQRTNVFTSSEQFDSADWLKQAVTVVANAATSPDGYTNADLIYPSSSGAIRAVYQPKTISASTDYTQSVYVKSAGKNFAALFDLSGGVGTTLWVNLTTGEITNGGGSNVSNRFATNVGNGWWRIGFTQSIAGTNGYMHVYGTDAAGSANVTVNGTDGIYAYGAQLEAGAYATSYIPTLSAASTRGAESCYKTSISDLIGQTEGTIFGEIEKLSGDEFASWRFSISDNTNDNWIFLSLEDDFDLRVYVRKNGSTNNDSQINNKFVDDGVYKIAMAYANNDVAVYVNGSLAYSSFSASIPNTTQFLISGSGSQTGSSQNKKGKINQAILFPTRLTNAELAALTTI